MAILLFAILHFVSDDEDPAGIVASLRDGVAGGSYLAISHIGTDFFPDKAALGRAVAVYKQASDRVWPRPRTQILGFFDGFDLLEPGLVPKYEWWPAVVRPPTARRTSSGAAWPARPRAGRRR